MQTIHPSRVPLFRPLACALVLACGVPLQATPPASFDATVTNGATSVAVHFVHHPIRGAGFQVQVQDAAGNLNAVAAPEARTYIGTVTGYPGASACALLQPDGTRWDYIVFEAGDQWWADNGTVTRTYGSKTFTPAWPTSPVVTPAQAAVVNKVVAGDVIADIPYNNFTATHGSNVDHAVYATEFCLMQANLIYLRDLGFLHRTGRVDIRGAQASDPYQTGDPLQTLRGQFGPFSGHEAMKFVAVPGYGGGASLKSTVGDWYSGAAVCDTDARGDAFMIWRHEVGHNHGGGDGQGGYCENQTLLNANQVGRLSGPEEAAMIAARLGGGYYNASVLEDLGGYTVNLPPRASLDTAFAEPGLPISVNVLGNDHDSNGDAITLLSHDATSAKGATLTRSVGTGPGGCDQIIYTAPATVAAGLDSFQYRIQDANGGEALGNVFVKVVPGELCAYWPLDGSTGTVVANDAITANGTSYNGAAWVGGTIGNALSFNGVNQYAKAYVNIPETNTAVSLWFRTTTANGGIYSVTEDGGGHDRHICLYGGNIKARIWNEETIASTGKNYGDGQWHQVVHTFGGVAGGQKLYVDGELVASGNKTQSEFNWQTSVHLGYAEGASVKYFAGDIDDVRVWNRALTAAEAAALAQRSGTANHVNSTNVAIVGGQQLWLDWIAPSGATSHDIYFGDSSEVIDGTPATDGFMGNYPGKPLQVLDTTPGWYYWRADELRDTTVFRGPVWALQYLGNDGGNALTLTQQANWRVAANDSFVQTGVLGGGGSLTKDGSGSLILGGNNTLSGGITITDGILQIGNGGTTGTLGTGPVTILSTLVFNRSDNYTFSGTLNGPGGLVQYGPGGLTLSGSGITYSGDTLLNGGTLTLAGTSAFNSAIQLNAGQLILDSSANDVILPKPISGTGPIQINGANNNKWTRLTAASTYTGGTIINAGGMLLLGNNTAAGSVLGDITNNGTLGLNHSNAWTFSNNVSGTGALNLYTPGGNPVTLSGNTITLATLNASNNPGGILADTTVNLTGNLNLASNSTLTVASGANVAIAGGMTQIGNAYAHTMSTLKVTGGNIAFGGLINDGWDGAYTILQTGGTLRAPGITGGNGGGTWPVDTYTLEGGTLVLGANGIYGPFYKWPWHANGGGLTMVLNLGGGTLSASANWATSRGVNLTGTNGPLTVAPAGYTITMNGVLGGGGGLNLDGSGTLLLTGANTYTGGTVIGAGTTLKLGNNTANGAVAGSITNNGTLTLYRNNAWTFANNVVGNGVLNLYTPGGNPVTLSGNTITLATLNANNNPGAILTDTTVNISGNLNLASNSTLTVASGANVTVAGGMTQIGNAYTHTMSTLKVTGGNIAFGGLINDGWDGAYTILQTGGTLSAPGITGGNGGGTSPIDTYTLEGGTLVLGANGIYGPHYKYPWFPNGGGVTLNLNLGGGTLSASANWSTSWGATLTGTNGPVTIAPAGYTITMNGAVSGPSGINLTGTGTLILSATNSYAGATNVGAGTLFGGAGGMTGPVTVLGTIAPGNTGAGNLVVNNTLTMAPGSAINWQVTNWTGAAGDGHDTITVNALDLTATPENPAVVRISAPALIRFSEATRVFPLIRSTDPITTFDPAKFSLDTSAFTAGQGTWSIRQTGNTIELVYGNTTDSDNDGTPDWAETGYYHTDPWVANTITSTSYATIPAHDYTGATGNWSRDAAGSVTAVDRRGEITYGITIAAGDAGVYEVVLTGGAAGLPRPSEHLPVIFSLDGAWIGNSSLDSNNGGSATTTVLTPWLTPGTHTLGILHDNYRADIQLRVDALEIRKVDGLGQRLAADNRLTRIPAASLTSPVCVEGITSQLASLALTAGTTTLAAVESIDTSFHLDVPLSSSSSATTLAASFQSGAVTESHDITWTPTNLCVHSALDIRQGDSLLLDAWTGGTPSGTFTVTLDGTLLADAQSNTTHSAGQPFAATFTTPGTHTLTATLSDQNVYTVTLRVHAASFGADYAVRTKYARDWTPSSIAAGLVVQADSRLTWQEITSGTAPRKFRVTPTDAGPRRVLARLPDSVTGAPGGILAQGTVNAYYLAYFNETADPMLVHTYPDGTKLMRASIVAVGLPPGVSIRLTSLYQGTIYQNGSNVLWLDADDFDQNGIATVYFEWAGGGTPHMCTYLDLFTSP